MFPSYFRIVLSTLTAQESGEQTERGGDSQTRSSLHHHQPFNATGENGHTGSSVEQLAAHSREKGLGSSIAGQPTSTQSTLSSNRIGGGEDFAKNQATRMSPLPREQQQAKMSTLPSKETARVTFNTTATSSTTNSTARVTFCTTPTSPTSNSSSKPPLQVVVEIVTVTLITLIHGDIVQGAARTVPILRNSDSSSSSSSSSSTTRIRDKSESSKLGDQEDLKRLTAELEV